MFLNLEFKDAGMLKRVFGPKRDEMVGDWRKLPNEELQYLYFFTGSAAPLGPGL
jgi:hypothetical protein